MTTATAIAQRQTTELASVGPTPATMLQLAIEKGATMDQLEKLMELQERWEANEARKAYVTAMARFKADPPKITKNKQVDFENRSGQRTRYKHATLDHVCDVIGSALSVVGISYRWQTAQDGARITVTCTLTHELGHSETTTLSADPDQSGGKNSIQAVGSTVTYLQRYTLLAAVGMATEDQDDDAKGAEQATELTQAIESIKGAESIEELQKVFAAAWKKHTGAQCRKLLTSYKDDKKKELDNGTAN